MAVLLVILAGGLVRLSGVASRSLEYDEIWTLTHYVPGPASQIFTNLTTPNNHPLQSLLVRGSVGTLGVSGPTVRLPALMAGIALLALIAWLAWRLTASAPATLAASALAAGNGALIHFAQTSRGYSLQTLLLWAWVALLLEAWRVRLRNIELAAVALTPVMAVVALPTSLLWLAPIGLLFALALWRERTGPWRQRLAHLTAQRRGLIVACLAGGGGCLLWLAHGLPQFAKGRAAFGSRVASLGDLGHLLLSVLPSLVGYGVLALAVLALLLARRRLAPAAAWLIALCPLLLAVLSSAGPTRVYLASIPALILAAALALPALGERLPSPWNLRLPWALAVAITLVSLYHAPAARRAWTPPDWPRRWQAIEPLLAPDCYPLFPAGEGYTIRFHLPRRAPEANLARLRAPRLLLSFTGTAISVTSAEDGGEELLRVPADFRGQPQTVAQIPATAYALLPLAEASPTLNQALVIAVFAPVGARFENEREAVLGTDLAPWGALNGFLQWLPPDDQGRRAGAAAYARLADAAELDRLRAVAELQPALRCYVLASAPATP